jgi:hypothetical protein
VTGALTSNGVAAGRFTPDGNLTVTRLEAQMPVTPAGCKTQAVIQVTDGTVAHTRTLTLTAASNDSGPIAIDFAAGVPISISVAIPAAGCKTSPQNANVVVQYKGR